MDAPAVLNEMPFVKRLGIEVLEAGDGRATGRLPLETGHTSNEDSAVAHGGVVFSMADTVGAAAVISVAGRITPTVDMRIDYLAPATSDLRAEAEVVRFGGSLALSRVELYDDEGTHVATAHGTYKTGGDDEGGPWSGAEQGVDGSE
jgi:uncharacterized protein (TIGR00369 family)